MSDHQRPTNGNGNGPHQHHGQNHDHDHSHGLGHELGDSDLVVELDADEKDQITVSLADSLGNLMREYVRGDTSYEELTIEVFATLQALISVREGELPLEWLDLLAAEEDEELGEENGTGPGLDTDGGEDNVRWLRGKPDA